MTAISGRNRHTFDNRATIPIEAADDLDWDGSQPPPQRVSTATNVARALLVLALIPVGAFYLYPRIYDLTATPYRLDQAVVSAGNYNPALNQIVEHEQVTLSAFAALEKMKASLASVLVTDAAVAAELNTLIGQITGDVQATLDRAGAAVTDLVVSLDILTAHIDSLNPPVNRAAAAVTADRVTMDAILNDARATAEKVHSTRLSAEESANDLSGR